MSTGTPTNTTVATHSDMVFGRGGKGSGLGDSMLFSLEQLVLIDHLIVARVATVMDSMDVETATATFGGPATTTSTAGEYLPPFGPNWDWPSGCPAC